ncbi:YecR family lipoprotein [Shewanella sp. NKUCC06_TVS]|uniref:YecR family lipoprotein n=1 Tax=Shewanella sp. NKUCC06_TVS TaxID=2842128 RepID=UPI001C5AC6BC|nr:YecR family lipoprotein [Shewanella sp. NKUCC06_TVS]MBW3530358.1 YecR-like lipofamily protein [Shewanella sp. NKUCC06_TVS]
MKYHMSSGSLALLTLVIVSGCSSVPINWTAMDGSKSNGTVALAYEYRPILDTPPSDDHEANLIANQKCQGWGYLNAEAFGGATKSCAETYNGDCVRVKVTKVFQCLK